MVSFNNIGLLIITFGSHVKPIRYIQSRAAKRFFVFGKPEDIDSQRTGRHYLRDVYIKICVADISFFCLEIFSHKFVFVINQKRI